MLFGLIFTVIRVVQLLIVGRVLAIWLKVDENNAIVRVLRETTEPLFELVRPLARKIPGPLDWSPVILLLGFDLLHRVLSLLA